MTIKLHPLSESSPDRLRKFNNISVIDQETFEKNGVGLYSLLGRADALITDYSSVYFDYLLLDRPIGFAVGDMKDYEGERGFTVDNPYEYMPGEKFSDGRGNAGVCTFCFQRHRSLRGKAKGNERYFQ